MVSINFNFNYRWYKIREGPATFHSLTQDVDRLKRNVDKMANHLQMFPSGVPSHISFSVDDAFSAARRTLEDASVTIEQSLVKAFMPRSGLTGKFISNLRRTCQANALDSKMSAVEVKVRMSLNQLLQLSLALSYALQNREHQEVPLPKYDDLSMMKTAKSVYLPATNTPGLIHLAVMDFDSEDFLGNRATPEGMLKELVLSSYSSKEVWSTVGAMNPAYAIVGMPGVGKTIALQGLAYDMDVRRCFPDGIYYMKFGQGATPQNVIRKIKKILARSGARAELQSLNSSISVKQAVDCAVEWFEGKRCLFLLDDLWPTESSPLGYLCDFQQLLRASPAARIAISTPSLAIAVCAGRQVRFEARDPLGTVSERIFMAYATQGVARKRYADHGGELRPSVSKILSICAGLPFALSVTGCAVSFLADNYGFERACDVYAVELENKRISLGDARAMDGTSLNASILLSLKYLEVEFLNWKTEASLCIEWTITDLYTGLCVLQNQAWIPVSVLSRLWQLNEENALHVVNLFRGLSLATLLFRKPANGSPEEAGIVLHDMLLNFCKRQAEKMATTSMWHAQVLNGYLEASKRPVSEDPSIPTIQTIASFASRSWWAASIPEDGYIHANLARHLSWSGQGVELAALLLDARWTIFRAKSGGIFALKSDFELLERCFVQWESSREQEARVGEVRRSYGQVFKAVQLSWGRMSGGLRAFQFEVCGFLQRLRESNKIVRAYLNSVETHTPKPYLLPMSPFFPELSGAQIMEIPVGGQCLSIACSPCGRYIAAEAENDIVVAAPSTGEILQRLKGHTEIVLCITFISGGQRIVSGSADRKLMVWEWETSATPVLVLEGHMGNVTGVAVSGDRERIFSTSLDRTLRIWNATTGVQTAELVQSSAVNCVAICGEDLKTAVGLDNGTLKVLDSITEEVLFEDTEAHEEQISSVSFSPHGLYLATGSWDKTIKVWNPQAWSRIAEYLEGHDDRVTSVAFSADGTQVASSSHDGTIRQWDIESGQRCGVSLKLSSPAESVSFTADGERIISGSHDGVVRVWDAQLGMQTKEQSYGHTGSVRAVSISPDGLRVASASGDGTVQLWDSLTGDQIGVPLEGHGEEVWCVSFSPDGRRVVSGSFDRTLRLWDTETSVQIGRPLQGHTDGVSCVCFSSDGLRIAAGSSDSTVRLWNAQTYEQIGDALRGHTHEVSCVSESAAGRFIVSRDISGTTIIWNRESRFIAWTSKEIENASGHCITGDEAETIIRSCGQEIPHLWPNSFPSYSAELFCEKLSVCSNLPSEKTFLANLEPYHEWKYNATREVFAAGLRSGAVAICKLIKGGNDGATVVTSAIGAMKPSSGLRGMAVEKIITVQGTTSHGKHIGAGSSSNHEEGFSNGNVIPWIQLVELLSLNDDCRSKRIASILEEKPAEAHAWGHVVKFSSRFSALWGDLQDRTGTVWFCNVDGEHSAFVLKSDSSVEEGEATTLLVRSGENSASIRCLSLRPGETSWSTLLQSAADFMEYDNEIRAVQVACLVCARVEGGKSCVSDALIPLTLKTLSTRVVFDTPVDVDLMTTLADALNIDHQLYFRCGLGTLAKVAGKEKGVCHLQGIEDPTEILRHLGSAQALPRLPILYGCNFGRFLNTEVPHRSKQVGEIINNVDLPEESRVLSLLWVITEMAENLYRDGRLTLKAAASAIIETPGTFLGTSRTRKIRGDVLIVASDGIYESSRFRGLQVEGSVEVKFGIFKLGGKIVKPAGEDKRIDNLKDVAEYILDRKYEMQHHDEIADEMVFGPEELWSEETAVCNTLVGLLCRKFGPFTGFSKVVCTKENVETNQKPTMKANIFLPALSVWPSGRCQKSSDRENWSEEFGKIVIEQNTVVMYAGPIDCETVGESDDIEIATDIWKGRTENEAPITPVLASRLRTTYPANTSLWNPKNWFRGSAHRNARAPRTPRVGLAPQQDASGQSTP